RLAVEQFRNHIRGPIVRPEIEDGQYVRVVERTGGAGLLLQAAESFRVVRELGGQNLDGDIAAEAGFPRAIDLSHPAGTERPDNFVWADSGAGREAHMPLEVRRLYGSPRTALGS